MVDRHFFSFSIHSPGRTVVAPLLRQVAGQRHPMHDPAESVVIVDGVVLGAAIVPEGEGARLPAETAGELGTDLMRCIPARDTSEKWNADAGHSPGVRIILVARMFFVSALLVASVGHIRVSRFINA
jgi:hypothetical protein